MIVVTLSPQTQTLSDAGLDVTLLDGASLYGIAMFDTGTMRHAFKSLVSEGPVYPYGQGAPDWGDFDLFSNGVAGVSFDCEWDLTGASAPTSYSLLSGDLPDGLALSDVSGNVGKISGTPTVPGSFDFTLRASNEFGTDDKAFSITIVAPAGGVGSWTFIS